MSSNSKSLKNNLRELIKVVDLEKYMGIFAKHINIMRLKIPEAHPWVIYSAKLCSVEIKCNNYQGKFPIYSTI